MDSSSPAHSRPLVAGAEAVHRQAGHNGGCKGEWMVTEPRSPARAGSAARARQPPSVLASVTSACGIETIWVRSRRPTLYWAPLAIPLSNLRVLA